MDLAWSADDEAFRAEVRAFLTEELTEDLRDATKRMTSVYLDPALSLVWQQKLHKRGWVAPSWPIEYGGCGWSQARNYIFARELIEAGAPPLSPMGLGMCGPVLIGYGSPEQKAYYLPRMLRGDDLWCQGYSETESGSDLATLRMKAERYGDDFVCNGHKIWTTHAHEADMMFCLVRTSSHDRPQMGITFLLIDMTSPGIEVQPILSLSGEHIQNLVLFDNVRVPVANAVGAVDDGWTVAKYLMEFERGGSLYSPSIRARFDRMLRYIKQNDAGTPDLLGRAATLKIDIETMDALELQLMSRLSGAEAPGTSASVLKVLGTELSQRLTELELESAGLYASAWQPHLVVAGGPTPGFRAPSDGSGVSSYYAAMAAPKYFNDRAGSIYAGTNEIQRNILWRTLERQG